MASRCRGYRSRQRQAFKDDPQSISGPAPPSPGLNDLKPLNLSTVLMAVDKYCYTSLNLTNKATAAGGRRHDASPERISYAREPSKLPVDAERRRGRALPGGNPKPQEPHRAAKVYAAGLRVSEVVLLKIADIDGRRDGDLGSSRAGAARTVVLE